MNCQNLNRLGLILTVLTLVFVPVSAMSQNVNQSFNALDKPDGWTVTNPDFGWRFDNPGGRTNQTGGQGNFAAADSAFMCPQSVETELITPSMNFTNSPSVRLTFKTSYKTFGNSKADVDVSVDGGNTWNTVWQKSSQNFTGTVPIDLTTAGGKSEVKVRFRYYDALNSQFWQIDDVTITGVSEVSGAPTGLNAAFNASSVALTWTDNSNNESGFKIERSETADSGFEEIGSVLANKTSYSDRNIECGKTYYYRTAAFNSAGKSGYADAAAQTGNCLNRNSVSENFDAQTLPDQWTNIETKWVFNDPNNRKDLLNDPNMKAAMADFAPGADLRTPPMNFQGRPGVTLSFKTFLYFGTNTGSADVDVTTDNGNTWTTVLKLTGNLNSMPMALQSVDISKQAGGKPNVMVRFLANSLNGLWIVDDVDIQSLPAPKRPANTTTSLGQNSVVNISWDYADTPKPNFEVERSTDAANWKKIADVKGGKTLYADSSAEGKTTYQYRVRSVNSAGNSEYTDPVSITTEDRSSIVYNVTISYYDSVANTLPAKKDAIENIIGHFADSVYEMSNGSQKLGRVTIYCGAKMKDKSDVVWVKTCHPNAHVSGYGKDGLRIEMCDLFGNTNYLEAENFEEAGYGSLGHEWGHYFHSLYDEYRNDKTDCDPESPGSPCKTDKAVQFSIMHNSDYAAASKGGDLRWLNFSTALNNTKSTAQHRIYGASCWETLIRPVSQDPRDGERSNSPTRLYHEEIKAAAPPPGQEPSIEIDQQANKTAARSALNIVWADQTQKTRSGVTATSGMARMIVIDRSVSTSQNQLYIAKAAVKQMIDSAALGDTLGVIAFGSQPAVVYEMTTLQSQADKDAMKGAVDGIVLIPNDTNIGAAMKTALTTLTAAVPENFNRSVYLITPGRHQSGVQPAAVIPDFQTAYVQVYAFGLSAEAGNIGNLKTLAEMTGGNYYSANNENDLIKVLSEASKDSSPVVAAGIKTGSGEAKIASPFEASFYIDASVGAFEIEFGFGIDLSEVKRSMMGKVTLLKPDGSPIDIPSVNYEIFTDEFTSDVFGFHIVEKPETGAWVGEWKIKFELTSSQPQVVYYRATALTEQENVTFKAYAESAAGDEIVYPEPILVSAFVGKAFPITDISVRGVMESPSGEKTGFNLKDDGKSPDHIAGDGYYAALLNPIENGDYLITVFFDNKALTGSFTQKGLQFALAPDGTAHVPITTPVDEKFERFAEITVSVSGIQDYELESEDFFTLAPNNLPISGKIKFAGDVDTYEIAVPVTYSGEMVIRIDELASGMIPQVYMYPEDRSWEIFDELYEGEKFLSTVVPVTAGQKLYVSVFHVDEKAEGGLYRISAGPFLPHELAFRQTRDTEDEDIAIRNNLLPKVIGDINGDRKIDLADPILATQLSAGLIPAFCHDKADVNGDNRIGVEEAMYDIQTIAGLRSFATRSAAFSEGQPIPIGSVTTP